MLVGVVSVSHSDQQSLYTGSRLCKRPDSTTCACLQILPLAFLLRRKTPNKPFRGT